MSLKKKVMTSSEIHENLVQILSENSPSNVTEKNWTVEF